MTADQNSIALFAAAVVLIMVGACFGLLRSLFEHPWLLAFVALAVIAYVLARREERRERGPSPGK